MWLTNKSGPADMAIAGTGPVADEQWNGAKGKKDYSVSLLLRRYAATAAYQGLPAASRSAFAGRSHSTTANLNSWLSGLRRARDMRSPFPANCPPNSVRTPFGAAPLFRTHSEPLPGRRVAANAEIEVFRFHAQV